MAPHEFPFWVCTCGRIFRSFAIADLHEQKTKHQTRRLHRTDDPQTSPDAWSRSGINPKPARKVK